MAHLQNLLLKVVNLPHQLHPLRVFPATSIQFWDQVVSENYVPGAQRPVNEVVAMEIEEGVTNSYKQESTREATT